MGIGGLKNNSGKPVTTIPRGSTTSISTKLEMDIPAFTMVEGRNQILAQGLKLETTQGFGDAVFDSGKTRFLITSFQRLDSDLSGGIKNLEMLWDTRIDKNKVAFDSTFKIGELSVPHSPVAKDIVMNLIINI